MIEPLDGMPDGTQGFRVSGDITREDYTGVLVPGLRSVVDQGGRLRTLYLIDRLDHMDPGALWEDAKVGFDLETRHHSAFERIAIATDQDWLVRATRLFAWMAPGECKVFPTAEVDDAKRWLAG